MELLYLSELHIFTDKKSVLPILRNSVDSEYTRYTAIISGFNFTMSYINTKLNGLADFLSRQEMINLSIDTSVKTIIEKNLNQTTTVKNTNKDSQYSELDSTSVEEMENEINEKCNCCVTTPHTLSPLSK
uniref:Reverse transcriptase RNase H-like domain-containing protein n=1 Tax=Strongyloides stercoralis TaxID=6248 RepID=A0AAF5DI01_STRER